MASFFPPFDRPLPPFQSLVIKGNYPPSFPLYLALSHLRRESANEGSGSDDVLLISPSQESFVSALECFNDVWITSNALTGAYASYFSRIKA